MFKDSVYDNLDDISQLVEPFNCRVNDELSKLPDIVDIDYEFLDQRMKVQHWGSIDDLSISSMLNSCVKHKSINWNILQGHLNDFFKLQIGDDPEKKVKCQINLEKGTLSNTIKIVKTSHGYTDEELYKKIVDNLRYEFTNQLRQASKLHKSNVNEIAEVFDIDEVSKCRGLREKRKALLNGITGQFKDRVINIRDYELGLRFTDWLIAYIKHNHMGAIKNITLFKVMMLNEKPIYSLDNEETL